MDFQKNTLIKLNPEDYTEHELEGFQYFHSRHSVLARTPDYQYFHLFDVNFLIEQVHYWLENDESRIYMPSEFLAELFENIYQNKKFLDYWYFRYDPDSMITFDEFIANLRDEVFVRKDEMTPNKFWSMLKSYGYKDLLSSAIEAAVLVNGKKNSISRLFAHMFIERGHTPFFSFIPVDFDAKTLGDYSDLTRYHYFITDLEKYPYVKESFIHQLSEIMKVEL